MEETSESSASTFTNSSFDQNSFIRSILGSKRRANKITSLDLGCGNNKVSRHFIGVDKRSDSDAKYIADIESLGFFEDKTINVIFTRRVLQHVVNDDQVFKEINRILTDDGIVVIEVSSELNTRVSKFLNKVGLKRYPYTTYRMYTKRALISKARDNGFKVVSYSLAPTRFPFKNHILILVKGGSS